jgi:chromosome segregation ATPase
MLAMHAAAVDAQSAKPAAKKTEKPRGKAAPKRGTAPSASTRKQHLQAEQRSLQQRLAALKKQLSAAEASHSDATDALRASEAAISTANRRLRELATERKNQERRIADLQDRSRAVAARQGEQESQPGAARAVRRRARIALAAAARW